MADKWTFLPLGVNFFFGYDFVLSNKTVFYYPLNLWQLKPSYFWICLQGLKLISHKWYIWAGSWENVSYVICKQQRRRSACMRSLISAFVVHCLDRKISLDSTAEISRLQLASVAAQAGLCLAWSETPEDTFSHGVAHIQNRTDTKWYFNVVVLYMFARCSQPHMFDCPHLYKGL